METIFCLWIYYTWGISIKNETGNTLNLWFHLRRVKRNGNGERNKMDSNVYIYNFLNGKQIKSNIYLCAMYYYLSTLFNFWKVILHIKNKRRPWERARYDQIYQEEWGAPEEFPSSRACALPSHEVLGPFFCHPHTGFLYGLASCVSITFSVSISPM